MPLLRLLLSFTLILSVTNLQAEEPLADTTDENEHSATEAAPEKEVATKRKRSRRAKINMQDAFRIEYGSSPWNTSSQAIDSAILLVRDQKTGKIAQINLEETEPDSSIFSGSFRLNWGPVKEIAPEVYIPPKNIRSQTNWIEQVNDLIRSGKLKRKPFIFQKDKVGQNLMEVFDTKNQAAAALKAYHAAKNLEKAKDVKIKLDAKKSAAAESLFEAAQLAAAKAAQLKMAQEAAARESERIRLAQIERQKMIERIQKEKSLLQAEKNRRRKEAANLAEQAMQKYRSGEYQAAVELFEKSLELDPSNKNYYYQYGVALYKIENYNKALVVLEGAEGADINQTERKYFMSLAHLRLNENEEALKGFDSVKSAKDKVLSPSAAFYRGVIYFDTQRYEEAKPEFESVLDTSQDPRLDERAEAYIERIAQILYFAQQQRTKFFFTGTFGLQYDSNILFSSDSSVDEGTATGEGGGRALIIGGFKYRPLYKKQHEFSTDLDLVYYYSFDDVFASADPFLATLSLPYVFKGTLFNKGYKLEVSPGYETLFMDAESTGSRDNILNSIFVDVTNTFVIRQKWFTDIKLGFRSDDSSITVTDPADDSSATKVSLTNTHTFFLNSTNSKMAIGSLGYTLNNADGDNNKYGRIDLSGTYMQPWVVGGWELSWINTITLYQSSYSDRSDDRKDFNYGLNSSLSKKLGEHWNMGLSAGYTRNSSNVDTFTYSQWNVMTTASFNYSL